MSCPALRRQLLPNLPPAERGRRSKGAPTTMAPSCDTGGRRKPAPPHGRAPAGRAASRVFTGAVLLAALCACVPGRAARPDPAAQAAALQEQRLLSFVFSDVDVRQVLATISDFAHVNTVVTPAARATISINL